MCLNGHWPKIRPSPTGVTLGKENAKIGGFGSQKEHDLKLRAAIFLQVADKADDDGDDDGDDDCDDDDDDDEGDSGVEGFAHRTVMMTITRPGQWR